MEVLKKKLFTECVCPPMKRDPSGVCHPRFFEEYKNSTSRFRTRSIFLNRSWKSTREIARLGHCSQIEVDWRRTSVGNKKKTTAALAWLYFFFEARGLGKKNHTMDICFDCFFFAPIIEFRTPGSIKHYEIRIFFGLNSYFYKFFVSRIFLSWTKC